MSTELVILIFTLISQINSQLTCNNNAGGCSCSSFASTVTSINNINYKGCGRITSVTIPSTVTFIGLSYSKTIITFA